MVRIFDEILQKKMVIQLKSNLIDNDIDIKDGVTVHLVIRAPKTTAGSPSASSTETNNSSQSSATNRPAANSFPFGIGLTPGLGNLNFANTNFLDMQQQFQQQVCIKQLFRILYVRCIYSIDHEQSDSITSIDGQSCYSRHN